jgi:serine/threonine-protein kinase
LLNSISSFLEQNLDPERWRQVERVFNAALELEPDARTSFLDQARGDDSWLRRKIDALFFSHEQARSFLESPASAQVAEESRIPERSSAAIPTGPPAFSVKP